jgi:hypothetical protein
MIAILIGDLLLEAILIGDLLLEQFPKREIVLSFVDKLLVAW